MSEVSYVYVIAVAGRDLVKIGRSNDPVKRLAGLQTACPFPLEMICIHALPSRKAAADVERDIHRAYRGDHANGEWFNVPPAAAAFVVEENVETWKCFFIPGYSQIPGWEHEDMST